MQDTPLKSYASKSSIHFIFFLACIVFGFLLTQVGIPDIFINFLMLAVLIGGYIFAGILGRTMQLDAFQTAGRSATPTVAAQAIASGILSYSVFILLAGEFYNTGTDALVIFSGIVLGIAFMTLLFAAPFNRSRAVSLGDTLTPGSTSMLVKLMVMLMVVITGVLLLVFQLSMIGKIASGYFGIAENIALSVTLFTIGFCLLMGGLQSLSIARIFAYPVLVVALLGPLCWVSYQLTGNPVPQLSMGNGALAQIEEINREMLEAGFATQNDILEFTREGTALDGFNYLTSLLAVAFGIAAMPHLLQHHKTLPNPRAARKAGFWSLGLVLVVLTAIPALAAYMKLDIYTSLLGLQVSDLEDQAPWLFALSNQEGIGLITLCGAYVASGADVITACGAGGEYFISLRDIKIHSEFVVPTFAALNELPALVTLVVATGCLFALWSTIDGLVYVISNTIVQDGFKSVLRRKSPSSFTLFVTRLAIIALLLATPYLMGIFTFDMKLAFEAAIALIAACLFPFLLLRFWYKSVPNSAILFGMITGFIITSTLLWLGNFGVDMLAGSGDEIRISIPAITDAISNLSSGIVGCLAMLMVSFLVHRIILRGNTSKSKIDKTITDMKSDVPA